MSHKQLTALQVAAASPETMTTTRHLWKYRIHLDCTFTPFGCKQCVIWDDLTHKNSMHTRMCVEYTLRPNGTYKKPATLNPYTII